MDGPLEPGGTPSRHAGELPPSPSASFLLLPRVPLATVVSRVKMVWQVPR